MKISCVYFSYRCEQIFVIFLLNASLYVMKLYTQNNSKYYFKEQRSIYAQLTLTFKNVQFFHLPEWTAIIDLDRINKFNLVK
jgi:hypothetical protein